MPPEISQQDETGLDKIVDRRDFLGIFGKLCKVLGVTAAGISLSNCASAPQCKWEAIKAPDGSNDRISSDGKIEGKLWNEFKEILNMDPRNASWRLDEFLENSCSMNVIEGYTTEMPLQMIKHVEVYIDRPWGFKMLMLVAKHWPSGIIENEELLRQKLWAPNYYEVIGYAHELLRGKERKENNM